MTGEFDSSGTLAGPPRPGDILAGKYRVESLLGTGGMGVVVLVQHIELNQRMAVKLMTPGLHHDSQAIARFLREARAAAGLQSEHVVRIFDVGTLDSGAPYIVMELLRGQDLSQVLQRTGRLPIHDAVDYVLQACHAIAEAHAMGVVHRDLKPSNLFLTRRSDTSALVKVLDFGISKAMDGEEGVFAANLTATSAIMGSPLYMSPEQVRNAKQVDGRADIWSLGVILHELLTGAPAFHADTLPGICAAIIADDPLPLRALREDAPAELEAVLGKCLEKRVTNRFQSVSDLMYALRPFASSRGQTSLSEIPSSGTLREAGLRSHSAAPSERTAVSASAPSRVAPAPVTNSAPPPSFLVASSAPVASTRPGPRAPETPRARPRPSGRLVGLLLAVGGVGFWAIGSKDHEGAAPAPTTEITPPVTRERKTFALVIDSTPHGAEVREGDKTLGTTPLQISVDNEAAGREARKLTVHYPGFQTYSLLQGPSDENVRIIASLVAASPESAGPAASRPPAMTAPSRPPRPAKINPPVAEPASETVKVPPAPPSDIRLER